MADWKNRITGYRMIDLDTIVPNPNNPKEHPEYQKRVLGGLIEEVGVIQNIIVNERTGHLVDGECRYFLGLENGEKSLPGTVIDVSEEEELKILATYDEITAYAKKNSQKLSDIVGRIVVKADGMRDLIDRIARRSQLGGNGDDEDDRDNDEDNGEEENLPPISEPTEEENYEKLIQKWDVHYGKVWKIKSRTTDGYHRLMCGDSQIKKDVELLVGDKRASLMVTDPPYGVDFKEQKYNPRSKDWDETENDNISGENYRKWISSLMSLWLPHMNVDASYYIWTAALYESFMCLCGIEDSGIHVQSQIVWNKNTMVLGQTDYQWKHENCWYGFMLGNRHRWYGGRDQTTVWNITKVANIKYLHPMQKPIELYAIPIKNHTRSGDICFDPFVGCGTQIIACENLSRLCYAMEISKRYVAVTLERITNELALEIEEA